MNTKKLELTEEIVSIKVAHTIFKYYKKDQVSGQLMFKNYGCFDLKETQTPSLHPPKKDQVLGQLCLKTTGLSTLRKYRPPPSTLPKKTRFQDSSRLKTTGISTLRKYKHPPPPPEIFLTRFFQSSWKVGSRKLRDLKKKSKKVPTQNFKNGNNFNIQLFHFYFHFSTI